MGKGQPINPYARFTATDYAYLQALLDEGKPITSDILLAALKANPGKPIPVQFIDVLIKALEQAPTKGRGRPPMPPALKYVQDHSIALHYHSLLERLQRRQDRTGLMNWSCLATKDWWQGPPHERAARMVAARYAKPRNMNFRQVLAIASEQGDGSSS